MSAVDLSRLETLTRNYAAFQARKSGLATALGGLMAILLFVAPAKLDYFEIQFMGRCLLEYLLLVPFAWLILKSLLGRMLYRGFGAVKESPDAGYERQRWFWIFGLAICLLLFGALVLLGFASGFLHAATVPPSRHPFPLWVLTLLLLYLAPTPWMLRGVEEARAYAVLVGLCLLWLTPLFLFSFLAPQSPHLPVPGASVLIPAGYVGIVFSVLAWSSLAMIRGWREHREYLALLRELHAREPVLDGDPS
jgi:hypothetical protein